MVGDLIPAPVPLHARALSPLGEAALAYVGLGWRVFPLHSIDEHGLCSCGTDCGKSAGKHPRVAQGVSEATDSTLQVRAWWRRWPDAGVGVATGGGIAVVDIDPDRNGDAGFAECVARLGELGDTLTCRTGSGGAHLYFSTGGATIRNSSDRLGPGVDVRGDGGYVVAPPTRHRSGTAYRWDGPPPAEIDLAPLTRPWVEAMQPVKRAAPAARASSATTAASKAQAEQWLRDKAPVAVEGRAGSSTCMAVMGTLRRMGIATAEDALDVIELSGWNARCVPPWDHEGPQGLRRKYEQSDASIGEPPRPAREWPSPRPAPKAPIPPSSPTGPGAISALSSALEARGEAAPSAPASEGSSRAEVPTDTPLPSSRERGRSEGDDGAWIDELLRSRSGDIKNTPWNAQHILAHDPRIRGLVTWDEHRADVMIRRRPPWLPPQIPTRAYPAPLDDRDIAWCGHWLQREYEASWTVDSVCTALTAVAHLWSCHPLREWLSGLAWDGVERTEDWLCDFLGATNTTLVRAYARRWLIAAVARVFDPGCKAENVLILEGNQGLGKSRALRLLTTGTLNPTVAGASSGWFTDERIDVENREGIIKLAGTWIAEFSELGSIKKGDVEAVKAFVSRQVDKLRFPWARRAIELRRTFIFAGTCNPDRYLTDPTGARRFWPVKCADLNAAGLQAVREQLWAEAVALYRRGDRWYFEPGLDDELIAMSAEAVKLRKTIDPWVDALRGWADGREKATTKDALAWLGVEIAKRTRADEMRAAEALRELGFTDHRQARDGGRDPQWFYFKPFVLEGG